MGGNPCQKRSMFHVYFWAHGFRCLVGWFTPHDREFSSARGKSQPYCVSGTAFWRWRLRST